MICLYLYIYRDIFFLNSVTYSLLQSIEDSFLCYTVNPCCLFILYMVVWICKSPTHKASLPCFPFSNRKFVFCVCGSEWRHKTVSKERRAFSKCKCKNLPFFLNLGEGKLKGLYLQGQFPRFLYFRHIPSTWGFHT